MSPSTLLINFSPKFSSDFSSMRLKTLLPATIACCKGLFILIRVFAGLISIPIAVKKAKKSPALIIK